MKHLRRFAQAYCSRGAKVVPVEKNGASGAIILNGPDQTVAASRPPGKQVKPTANLFCKRDFCGPVRARCGAAGSSSALWNPSAACAILAAAGFTPAAGGLTIPFGTERVMSRVGLVVAAVAGLGAALAGCSGMPDWMSPDWLSSKSAEPQLESVQFDSQPPGAEVRSEQGQTCLTPCALSIPGQSQAVTINKIGFVPQTVQITAGDPPDHSFWESAPPPTLVPNPVQVVLQAVPPPPRAAHRHKPREVSSRTRTAAKTAPPQGSGANPFPDPPPQSGQPAPSAFPPPATEPAASPFPPPPAQGQ